MSKEPKIITVSDKMLKELQAENKDVRKDLANSKQAFTKLREDYKKLLKELEESRQNSKAIEFEKEIESLKSKNAELNLNNLHYKNQLRLAEVSINGLCRMTKLID